MRERTTDPLPDVVPALLQERGLSLRALASSCQVDVGFLSRVLRREDGKVANPDLAGKVAQALDLPGDYFLETRRGWVITRLHEDAALVDRVYDDEIGRAR